VAGWGPAVRVTPARLRAGTEGRAASALELVVLVRAAVPSAVMLVKTSFAIGITAVAGRGTVRTPSVARAVVAVVTAAVILPVTIVIRVFVATRTDASAVGRRWQTVPAVTPSARVGSHRARGRERHLPWL
jgi:hypothetical protein